MARGLLAKAMAGAGKGMADAAPSVMQIGLEQYRTQVMADRDASLRQYQTGERVAGQEFTAEQNKLSRGAETERAKEKYKFEGEWKGKELASNEKLRTETERTRQSNALSKQYDVKAQDYRNLQQDIQKNNDSMNPDAGLGQRLTEEAAQVRRDMRNIGIAMEEFTGIKSSPSGARDASHLWKGEPKTGVKTGESGFLGYGQEEKDKAEKPAESPAPFQNQVSSVPAGHNVPEKSPGLIASATPAPAPSEDQSFVGKMFSSPGKEGGISDVSRRESAGKRKQTLDELTANKDSMNGGDLQRWLSKNRASLNSDDISKVEKMIREKLGVK